MPLIGDVAVRPKEDWYATDPEYSTALVGRWRHRNAKVWELACGDGALAKVLVATGHDVVATDLIDRGYGEGGVDFLSSRRLLAPILVTNPPYHKDLPLKFAAHALSLGAEEVWLLLREAWWCAPGRWRSLRDMPLRFVWSVGSRAPMWPGGRAPHGKDDATLSYYHAWFGFGGDVHDPKIDVIPPRLDLLQPSLLKIAP